MPIERRSSRTQTTTLVISVVALVAVVLLAVLVVRAATGDGQVALNLGDDTFDAGRTVDRAAAIAADGPILFSDVSGRGQVRPIFLSHVGDDPAAGWWAFDARPEGAPAGCFLEWDRASGTFRGHDGCDPRTFPPDGAGLRRYLVTVSADDELTVDFREGPTGS